MREAARSCSLPAAPGQLIAVAKILLHCVHVRSVVTDRGEDLEELRELQVRQEDKQVHTLSLIPKSSQTLITLSARFVPVWLSVRLVGTSISEG